MAKSERAMKKDLKEANAEVFYKAFRSMDSASRRRLALRILKDEALLEDLYDHFLIQEAEKEKGRSIPWEEYLDKRDRRTS
ncbi:MAG TPA: hypothetical protein VGL70_06985 [Candidatus Binatia bacterium]|jgi:hypothetical protein